MSVEKYRPWSSADQSFLLSPSPREWLNPNHLAFFVIDVVAKLDLSAIEHVIHAKDPRGERPFSPPRKWMIEPVFGQIKEAMGFRRFMRRGIEAARAEWAFVCTAHNLLKMWRAGAPLPA